MAFYRITIALFFIATVLAISFATDKDLIVGSRAPNDYLIQNATAKKSHQWLQIVKLKQTYPGDNYSKITQVRLLDQNTNGNGATATILNGGPGSNFVTVEFKSVRGHSIDFIVELYGKH